MLNKIRRIATIARLLKERDGFRADQVRLIDSEGEQLGTVSLAEAKARAKECGLDLVVVAEKADPPVCRIMDYGKLVYEQKKNIRSQKKKQLVQKLKEVKFRVNIDKHDYDYKIKHAVDFLSKGCKLKVTLMFRGREMAHKDIGFDLIRQVTEDIKEYGNAENTPKLLGRNITLTFSPVRKGH